MVEFAVELRLKQKRAGRAFVFEHPRSATSWEVVERLKDLLEPPDVYECLLDMCCFDLTAVDDRGEIGLVRKPTRLQTNAKEIVDARAFRCRGGHAHVHLLPGRATHAAIYLHRFCEAILKGCSFLGS